MTWSNVERGAGSGIYYSVLKPQQPADEMALLREIFPDGEANEMNFVLFSTSGVHGHYCLIESAEAHLLGDAGESSDVTFLVVHPRIVCLRYGNCKPTDLADIEFLKRLRASSLRVVATIGVPAPATNGTGEAA